MGETSGGAITLNVNQAEKVNVEHGCSIPDPCDSNPCPLNSYCNDDWDSYSCSCDPGQWKGQCDFNGEEDSILWFLGGLELRTTRWAAI